MKYKNGSQHGEHNYILPKKIGGRKVTATDVIHIWEYGIGYTPPMKHWKSRQKLVQQSKFSRWKKIVDIFMNHCEGSMSNFKEIFSDSNGRLLPIAAILSRFECCYRKRWKETYPLHWLSERMCSSLYEENHVKETLRNVDPITALELWEYGNNSIPPLMLWPKYGIKLHKYCYERIRKAFKIYSKTFGENIERYRENCFNEKAEVVSLDTFLKKYEFGINEKEKIQKDSLIENIKDSVDNSSGPYILPRMINGKKISPNDVIQLWYYGNGDVKAINTWTSQEKTRQQSKISRWKKIIDIFENKFSKNLEAFEKYCTKSNGKMHPVAAVVSMYEEEEENNCHFLQN